LGLTPGQYAAVFMGVIAAILLGKMRKFEEEADINPSKKKKVSA
jgi:hypothetical protein